MAASRQLKTQAGASMDAVEYKHVVLCLIFLEYISDTLEERHAEVLTTIWRLELSD